MPLPLVSYDTLTATGEFLPLSDYFNPLLNRNFGRDLVSADRRDGVVTIGDVISLAKILVTPGSIDEILRCMVYNRTASEDEFWVNSYRAFYDMLPADRKYLIFFFNGSANVTRSNPFRYSFALNYPTVATREWDWGQNASRFDFDAAANSDGILRITQADIERLTPIVAAASETAHSHYESKLHVKIQDDHPDIPFFIRGLFRYSRDASIFYPHGNRDLFPVPYDWARPSHIVNWAAQEFRVTTRYDAHNLRFYYTVKSNTTDRRHIRRLHNYSANVLELLPYVIRGPKEPKAVTYGVELEACGDYTVEQLIDAQKALFFICKSDGSIWGDKPNCYELVTVPASLKAHKRLWAEFFEKVDYNLFDCSKNTGNGMHVHIDRKAFTNKHLNRFTWFMTSPSNEDFILAVSERPNKRNLDEWAPRPNHFTHATKFRAARAASSTNVGLRGAIHYKRQVSVEVRLFKGIVSYATIVKNLEFVDSVYHYTQQTMLSSMSLRSYLSWLEKTPKNQYQMLKTFLAEIKLEDLVISSEVSDLIWNERQDHIVVQKLNKAPFKITNTHITALNKKRRKRTFILKDGKVICITASGGLLAKLDKSVQQKQVRGAATFAMTEFAA